MPRAKPKDSVIESRIETDMHIVRHTCLCRGERLVKFRADELPELSSSLAFTQKELLLTSVL